MSYLRVLWGVFALAASAVLAAPAPDPATWLGASEQTLTTATPDLQRVRQPQRLASGARGLWQQDGADWAGLPFRQTFYVAQGKVQRVELLWQPPAGAAAPDAAWTQLTAALQARYGAPLVAGDTVSWAVADTDVAAYRQTGAVPALRVVFKVRELRDASTL